MKTNAQTYFEAYKERFISFSDGGIISAFNKEVGVKGWGTARASFLDAIHSEFDRRKIDYSLIGDAKTLSFKNQITLIGKKVLF